MKITIRQKDLENGNRSLYLDIYEKGRRKFEFLSLYLVPEIDDSTRSANLYAMKRAQEMRAERILHPETIPELGHQTIEPDIPDDDSPELLVWIDTYIERLENNTDYTEATINQTRYLKARLSEFLTARRRKHITLQKFDKTWFKDFFSWLKNEYVPHKYVRIEAKPLGNGTLCYIQRNITTVFNRAVRAGKIKLNPFYQMDKADCFPKQKTTHQQYLTPEELKLFMASKETSPGVAETQRAFGFACLTGLRISDINALRWSDITINGDTATLVIVQKKTKEVNAVPICSTAMVWLPERGTDDKVFHLPARANVDAALKRIAKRARIEKNISFHTARHTFGTLIQATSGELRPRRTSWGISR